MTKCFTSRLTLSPSNLISGKMVVKKKRQRFPKPSTCIAEFLHVTVRYPRPGWRILTPLPIKIRTKACVCGTLLSFRIDKPMSNCCSHETLLHFGLQKLSFEYLQLSPRSAPGAVLLRLTPRASQQTTMPSYSLLHRVTTMIEYRTHAQAPSIFGAGPFGR